MEKTLLRLAPYFLLLLMLAAIGFFLFSRGNDSGSKAKYTDGIKALEMDGNKYELINDITAETYVGSKILSVAGAGRGEQVGIIKSMGVITIAKLFRVLGDTEGKYLIDNTGRLYMRTGIGVNAAEVREAMKGEAFFSNLHIVNAKHDPYESKELTPEEAEMLRSLPDSAEEISVPDKSFIMDYSNRREIFGFTEDGLIYKVTMELFLYKDAVYLTSGFEGDKNTAKEQKLSGRKLPDEWQEKFAEYWK